MMDKIYALDARYQINGVMHDVFDFVRNKQLMDPPLWKKFVAQFQPWVDIPNREKPEFGGWRCEYWGKMMRGAAWVYDCTRDEELYEVLENTARELLTRQDELGRISSYPLEHELTSWDLWGRKYVLLGMQYFSEICRDEELKKALLESQMRQVDAIMAKIGDEEGKICISDASRNWKGINSCSILEPVIRLYMETGEKRFFDFATYIVNICENGIAPIFKEAYEGQLDPYQYTVFKAYEVTSCFEGLAEYYRVTKNEKYLTMLCNYAYRLLTSDITIIGSGGCYDERFDNSSKRQTDRENKRIVQETCVTVTLMKFFREMLRLTGDVTFADHIERAFYNAYNGALNTKDMFTTESNMPIAGVTPGLLPFDSYSPLTVSKRGRQVGGFQVMADGSFYGCCACIGSAGIGMMPQFAVMQNDNGIVVNQYYDGATTFTTKGGQTATLAQATAYPYGNRVEMTLTLDCDEAFAIQLRVPAWSRKHTLTVNGEAVDVANGYNVLNRTWKSGDKIVLELDDTTYLVTPPEGAADEDKMRAIQRGAVVYAVTSELGEDPFAVHQPLVDADGRLTDVCDVELDGASPYYSMLSIGCADGRRLRVVDYASAGKDYLNDDMCAWFPIKE
ncbi:MAG: glycoside hydrolase family 127 protein [Clostridia bacterium]|nr:glycoside hydrolase family 127 protein [Clostridia bacterium]